MDVCRHSTGSKVTYAQGAPTRAPRPPSSVAQFPATGTIPGLQLRHSGTRIPSIRRQLPAPDRRKTTQPSAAFRHTCLNRPRQQNDPDAAGNSDNPSILVAGSPCQQTNICLKTNILPQKSTDFANRFRFHPKFAWNRPNLMETAEVVDLTPQASHRVLRSLRPTQGRKNPAISNRAANAPTAFFLEPGACGVPVRQNP